MSFDLNLNTVCNHRIFKELVALDEDRRSLRMSKPLASSNIDVYASGDKLSPTLYVLIYDPKTITVQQPRMVCLKNKWKSLEDFFEISYNTISGFCPKCVGLGTLNDISYDVRGQLSVARNEKLLLQNLEKFVVTELGSNPFHSFIGTRLVDLLGQRIRDIDYITNRINSEINNSLMKLKDMQQQYLKTGRPITAGEMLDQILDIRVSRDVNDPTIIRAEIIVKAMSGKTLSLSQYLKLAE